jgi:hypothetical protein
VTAVVSAVTAPCLHGGYHRDGQCPEANSAARPVPFDGALIEVLEATNAVIGDNVESVEVGPIAGRSLVLTAPDLLVSFDAVKRLIDQAEVAVMDARQDRADAERHECYCGVRLEADELTCGSSRCEREFAMDASGLIP